MATKEGLKKLLEIEVNKISKSFIESMFASYHDRETGGFHSAPFTPYEKITLTKELYPYVKKPIETTLGQLLFNRYILERLGLIEQIGYFPFPITEKTLGELNKKINNLVLMDVIDTAKLGEYVDARDRLGFWCVSFLSTSITPGLIRRMDNVHNRKETLFKEKADRLYSDDPTEQILAMNEIEDELIDIVKENLKKDEGYDFYASGDGNLRNNYKNINVTRGAIYNPGKKKYDIVKNSFNEGLTREDITAASNSITAGAYPSAVGTADAGYLSKQILALLQSEHIDEDIKSDCGTKSTIPFEVTDRNKKYVLFRYIQLNGKTVMTNLDNIDSFVGKTIHMYSPQCCLKDSICAKCAGKTFYNLGVTKVGLLVTQMTMKLLNLKLKAKHDSSQSAGIVPSKFIFMHENKYAGVKNNRLVNTTKMRMFIPKEFDKSSSFYIESTFLQCMGIFPVKFYDSNDKEIFSTYLSIPSLLEFNIYTAIQEDAKEYTVTYEPDSEICRLDFQQNILNIEEILDIFVSGRTPQIPYNILVLMVFRCLEMNKIDLTAPSIVYELLSRRTCHSGTKSFAYVYGKDDKVDQMSYTKNAIREAVQKSGILQGMMFEDLGMSIQTGLQQTIRGIDPTPTPLESIIKA
jgi:hypothetical protein